MGGCGSCHTFADAGTSGAIGPNLDDAAPSFELAVDRVTNGQGAMPPFGEQLERAADRRRGGVRLRRLSRPRFDRERSGREAVAFRVFARSESALADSDLRTSAA